MYKTGGKLEPTRKMVYFSYAQAVIVSTFILSISSLLKDKYNGKKFEEKVRTFKAVFYYIGIFRPKIVRNASIYIARRKKAVFEKH